MRTRLLFHTYMKDQILEDKEVRYAKGIETRQREAEMGYLTICTLAKQDWKALMRGNDNLSFVWDVPLLAIVKAKSKLQIIYDVN